MLVVLSVNDRIADTHVSTATAREALVFPWLSYGYFKLKEDDFEKKTSSRRRIRRSLICGQQRQENNEMTKSHDKVTRQSKSHVRRTVLPVLYRPPDCPNCWYFVRCFIDILFEPKSKKKKRENGTRTGTHAIIARQVRRCLMSSSTRQNREPGQNREPLFSRNYFFNIIS